MFSGFCRDRRVWWTLMLLGFPPFLQGCGLGTQLRPNPAGPAADASYPTLMPYPGPAPVAITPDSGLESDTHIANLISGVDTQVLALPMPFAAPVETDLAGVFELDAQHIPWQLGTFHLGTFHFPAGSDRLFPSDRALVARLVATIRQRPDTGMIRVVGHASRQDEAGAAALQLFHLSLDRARTVADALTNYGLSASRLCIEGRGSAQPALQDRNDPAYDRRVDVLLQD